MFSLLYKTAYSFIDLIEELFKIDGVKSFLSQKICQDPLENFFGCQRQQGAVNENPSVSEFLKNNQALRIIDFIQIETSKGNTRGTDSDTFTVISDLLPHHKKRRREDNVDDQELGDDHSTTNTNIQSE